MAQEYQKDIQSMDVKSFDYDLPKGLIAAKPARPRDAARLLVYERLNTKITHATFKNIGKFLRKGDVLVLNDTRVIPARLVGRLVHNGGTLGRKFKILLLKKEKPDAWTCLIDGHGRRVGLELYFSKNLRGKVAKRIGEGMWELKFNKRGRALDNFVFESGRMPLPPYIKQVKYYPENSRWYQTVYAKHMGSVAAPTAGLHFTPRLLKQLKKQGVRIEYITLHIGPGTFLPVKTKNIENHKMHAELAIVLPRTAKALNGAKKEGRRVVACGTTAMRALESFTKNGKAAAGKRYVDIFIHPPYRPKFVDALITNFHLPRSTLVILVAAFLSPGNAGGIKIFKNLYDKAIRRNYRFYSYGDAMLIF